MSCTGTKDFDWCLVSQVAAATAHGIEIHPPVIIENWQSTDGSLTADDARAYARALTAAADYADRLHS